MQNFRGIKNLIQILILVLVLAITKAFVKFYTFYHLKKKFSLKKSQNISCYAVGHEPACINNSLMNIPIPIS